MSAVEAGRLLLFALAGVALAGVGALLPGLHVTNAAVLVLLAATGARSLPPQTLAFFMLGLAAGYGMLNTLPAVFLALPDESSVFLMAPGQKYLRQGRGYEAVALAGLGGVGGLAVLVPIGLAAPVLLPQVHALLRPHLHWIVWAVSAWTLLGEWPKSTERAPAGWPRWCEAWRSLAAGMASFVLSGLLGTILLTCSPLPTEAAYQKLLPAFAGLFAVPWIVGNLFSCGRVGRQHAGASVDLTPGLLLRGTFAGTLGGLLGAFFPGVSAGVGALIATHATAQPDDRLFLVSQGACRMITYTGALLLAFIPGLHVTRGGLAWLLSPHWEAVNLSLYVLAVAAVLLAGSAAFVLSLALARGAGWVLARVDYRWLSVAGLGILLATIVVVTGWLGLLVCAVAAAIGMIPLLWGSRRLNLMGVVLVPVGLQMIGLGETLARWMSGL